MILGIGLAKSELMPQMVSKYLPELFGKFSFQFNLLLGKGMNKLERKGV
jgi:hypothetical protein